VEAEFLEAAFFAARGLVQGMKWGMRSMNSAVSQGIHNIF
jgi:hypothetical protein